MRYFFWWEYRMGKEMIGEISQETRMDGPMIFVPRARSSRRFEPGTIAAWMDRQGFPWSKRGRGGTAHLDQSQVEAVIAEFGERS